jgi:hypothetical protein
MLLGLRVLGYTIPKSDENANMQVPNPGAAYRVSRLSQPCGAHRYDPKKIYKLKEDQAFSLSPGIGSKRKSCAEFVRRFQLFNTRKK